MAREFSFKGKTLEDLKKMGINDLKLLLPARQRRTLTRGFNERQKIFLKKVDKANEGQIKRPIKTHCRDLIVLPKMVGLTIMIHNGKEFQKIIIEPEMIGHYLGEFALTRKRLQHSAPGIGATKSTSSVSVK